MIGRLLVAAALVISVLATLGLAVFLELDRAGATTVWMPVTVASSQGDLIVFRAEDPVRDALFLDRDWAGPGDESDAVFLVLTLDDEGRVIGAVRQSERPADSEVWLHIRTRDAIMPTSTRLPEPDHARVHYVRLKVSGGEAYEAGLADQDLVLLGRGDRAW